MKLNKVCIVLLALALSSCALKDAAKGLDLSFSKESFDKVKAITGRFSEEDEVKMGSIIISSLLGAAPLVDDPSLQRYVNNVGYLLAMQSSRPNLPWTFGVLDNENINAFAAPGGYILLTKGLLRNMQNEAELAAVIAHEIIHVEQKHHLNVLKKSSRMNLAAGFGAKQLDNGFVDSLVGAGTTIYSSGLDKGVEYEADALGSKLLAKAGYNPYALLDLLTTLESINEKSSALALLTKTHPPFASRIERLDQYVEKVIPQGLVGKNLEQRFLSNTSRL